MKMKHETSTMKHEEWQPQMNLHWIGTETRMKLKVNTRTRGIGNQFNIKSN